MLSKLEFNNLVVTHKGDIRQARVQTINKLVHKLRRLKDQKEKQLPQDVNKLDDKLMKITETINQIKQLKGIDLMKNVLLLEKQPTAYITNAFSTPGELSVAMLALNKVMSSLINTFKLTFCLEETVNPNWKTELQDIGKRRQKPENCGGKKMKPKHTTNKERKPLERCKSNQDNASTNSTVTVEQCKTEIIKSDNKIEKVEFLKINDSDNGESAMKPKTNPFNKSSELGVDQECEETFVVDPFFLTESGNNYLSTAKQKTIKCNEGANENMETFGQYPSKRQFPISSRDNQRHCISQNYNANKKADNIHPSWAAKQKPMIANFKGKKTKFDQESEVQNKLEIKPNGQNKSDIIKNDIKDLHPSWAAKQKLKPIITAFQGKKIVFNNDDE